MMDKILIIIPAFNEENVIEMTVTKVIAFCKKYEQFSYVVIDDGSRDNTKEILTKLNANFISHPINLGIGEPFKTGIKYGLNNDFNKFINFDGDGQHRLDSLMSLVNHERYDYIVGSRYVNEKKPLNLRMIGSRILSLLIKLRTGIFISDPTSGLVVINSRSFAKYFISLPSNNPEPSIFPKILGEYNVLEVQVFMNERTSGNSYFNVYTSIHFMLEQVLMIILKG